MRPSLVVVELEGEQRQVGLPFSFAVNDLILDATRMVLSQW